MVSVERAGHPVEAIHYRQLVPIRLSLHMCTPPLPSIPRASTTCSNSFSTQLLHPVGMWVNVNLMVCHSLCI